MSVTVDRTPAEPDSALDRLVAALRAASGVLDLMSDGVVLHTFDGTIVWANSAAGRLVGRVPGDGTATEYLTFVVPADRPAIEAQFRAVVDFGRAAIFDARFLDADGGPVEASIRLSPAYEGAEFVGVFGVATDMTARNFVEKKLMRSQLQFRSLFEHYPNPIAMIKPDGTYSRVNSATEKLLGITSEELVGKTNDHLMMPDRAVRAKDINAATSRGETVEFESALYRGDGSIAQVEGIGIPMIVDGVSEGYFAVMRDVTLERLQHAELDLASQRIHELYLVAAGDAANPRQQIQHALELGVAQLGYNFAYVARVDDGRVLFTHTYAASGELIYEPGDTLELEQSFARHVLARGGLFYSEDGGEGSWSDDAAGYRGVTAYLGVPLYVGTRPYGVLGFATNKHRVALTPSDRDFSLALAALTGSAVERSIQAERLDALAFYDVLTGLPNRTLLFDRLERLIATSRRRKRRFALHFIDFDDFKTVNDRFGHVVGDAFLNAMGARIKLGLRESDTLARLGGDEFVVLQPDIDTDQNASDFAAKLIALCDVPFRAADVKLALTMSIGIAIFSEDGNDAETLLAHADAALYSVKNEGRNGFRRYDQTMRPKSRRYAER